MKGRDEKGRKQHWISLLFPPLFLLPNQTKQLQQDEGKRCEGEETTLEISLISSSFLYQTKQNNYNKMKGGDVEGRKQYWICIYFPPLFLLPNERLQLREDERKGCEKEEICYFLSLSSVKPNTQLLQEEGKRCEVEEIIVNLFLILHQQV